MKTNKDIRISVVIPVFNCAEYISESLNSVFSQTIKPHEVIVVDDGSTDNLNVMLKAFKNNIIHIRQKNQGVSAARNTGITISSGEYIAFLDADDIWFPEKLELQCNLIKPGTDFIFCYKEVFDDDTGETQGIKYYSKKCCERPIEVLLTNFFASPSTVLVKRSLIISVGCFDEQFKNCEDSDLWIRLAPHTQFALVEKPLVRYRIRKGSLSNTVSFQDAVNIFQTPLLKNRKLIQSELNMTNYQFEKKIEESRNKLQKIYSEKGI